MILFFFVCISFTPDITNFPLHEILPYRNSELIILFQIISFPFGVINFNIKKRKFRKEIRIDLEGVIFLLQGHIRSKSR